MAVRSSHIRSALGAIVVLGIGACADRETTAPRRSSALSGSIPVGGGYDIPAVPRFDVTVQVSGSLRPHARTTIRAVVAGRQPTGLADIAVHVPELSVLQARGGRFEMPTGIAIAPQARWQAPVTAGGTVVRTADVVFPAEGYYQVRVSAAKVSAEPDAEAWVLPTGEASVWVLVGAKGGRVTTTFDPSQLPEDAIPTGGPLRSFRDLPSAPVIRPQKCLPGDPGCPQPPRSCCINGHVNYLDKFFPNTVYRPANGERVRLTIGGLSGGDFYTTLGGGTFGGLPCPRSGEPAHLAIEPTNVVADVYSETGSITGWTTPISTSACGTTPTYNVDANNIVVFEHLNTVQGADNANFGRARARVVVYVEQSNSQNNSYYSPSEDAIHLLAAEASGDRGAFVQAHEYGHAFLEKAFVHNDQGARWATGACQVHYIERPSDQYCAYSEGFADYHSIVTYPTSYTSYVEQTLFVQGYPGQGQSIEGSVAAYFLDITDGINASERDSVSLPGRWLADVLSGCEYQPGTTAFPGGVREVLGWRRCFENQASYIRFNPAVTFPVGWNPATLGVLYNRNIDGT
jgi:hypothetical protein